MACRPALRPYRSLTWIFEWDVVALGKTVSGPALRLDKVPTVQTSTQGTTWFIVVCNTNPLLLNRVSAGTEVNNERPLCRVRPTVGAAVAYVALIFAKLLVLRNVPVLN